jgi:hypothetical protein
MDPMNGNRIPSPLPEDMPMKMLDHRRLLLIRQFEFQDDFRVQGQRGGGIKTDALTADIHGSNNFS